MNISGFIQSLRIGTSNKVFADVFPIGKHPHSDNGFIIQSYLMKSYKDYTTHKVEVRKKERQVALIVYHLNDAEINPYWQDAEILFSWEEGKENEE